jgi:lysozyme family protein
MRYEFGSLRAGYEALFGEMGIRTGHEREIARCVSKLVSGRARYEAAGGGRIPWAFIGILHGLETGFDFSRHLHNGDPLAARTVHVPKGRPASGEPPFSFEESAADALALQGLDGISAWPAARLLYEWERYNGFGYRRRGLASPYLWSFSTHYERGKYGGDGRFDPALVSRQCGAAVQLRALIEAGHYSPASD